jgi:hypothetical protein
LLIKKKINNIFKHLLCNLKMLSLYLPYEEVYDMACWSYNDRVLCGAAVPAVVIRGCYGQDAQGPF